MSPICSKCGNELDIFHSCSSNLSTFDSPIDSGHKSTKSMSLLTVVALAPFLGVILDLFLPLPSSLVHSILVSICGSTIVAALWVAIKHQGNKTLKFYLKNFKNFVFTPLILKIFTTEDSRKAILSWLGAIILSSLLQLALFTPGNSNYLESQVSNQIDESSGANLLVDCPSNLFYFYNQEIECRIKTGILGITVPARAELNPILGTSKIKVSLI